MMKINPRFDENNLQGLSDAEVRERLATDGYNELPTAQKRTFLKMLLEVIREPMFLLLILCGVLYLVLGDVEEALMLLGFVFIVIAITLFQEPELLPCLNQVVVDILVFLLTDRTIP